MHKYTWKVSRLIAAGAWIGRLAANMSVDTLDILCWSLCSEFLHASSIQGTPKSKRGWQLWLQCEASILVTPSLSNGACFRPWQRQAEVQRAVASEAQWIRTMGQLTVWLFSFVCISFFINGLLGVLNIRSYHRFFHTLCFYFHPFLVIPFHSRLYSLPRTEFLEMFQISSKFHPGGGSMGKPCT